MRDEDRHDNESNIKKIFNEFVCFVDKREEQIKNDRLFVLKQSSYNFSFIFKQCSRFLI